MNDKWLDNFPNSLAVFGEPGISDHSPCCIFLDSLKPRLKKPFKFLSLLNQNPEFSPLIGSCWNALEFDGSKMLKISKKLKEMKSIIRHFSKENYSGIEKRVSEAYAHLLSCQQRLLQDPSSLSMSAEKEAFANWSNLAKAEDSFLHQCARVKWIGEGDANTSFFHRSIKSRQSQNHIHFLLDEAGQVLDSRELLNNHIVGHFENLLGGQVVATSSTPEAITAIVPYRCSFASIDMLSAPISPSQIQQAFFALPKAKAPGPDGYPAEFFTAHWNVVGRDMIDAVSEFFTSGKLLKQWNATILSLVPKKLNANRIGDFRPISCCNTVYKVASRLLANRLKAVLPDVTSSSQSAFIPGRLLPQNVLLATELIQGYNWKQISKRAMLKVDLNKAFDSINWNFIIHTLTAMNFPPFFINLIREYISTTQFSVCINGELCGYFKGIKGLRQGDPLSPYLFVIALEVFSHLLNREYNNANIGFHPLASDPHVSHLAFADDIMVFFDGEENSLRNITSVLDNFHLWSGLQMNKDKTELFTAGLNHEEATTLSSIGFSFGSLPVRYLGLPLMHRKLRISDYRPLLDQL